MTAYMLWLQDVRNKIKADNPGIPVTEVSKKAGAMWKTVATIEKKVILKIVSEPVTSWSKLYAIGSVQLDNSYILHFQFTPP